MGPSNRNWKTARKIWLDFLRQRVKKTSYGGRPEEGVAMNRYQRPEQPKPIGTIVGVVLALGAILTFMILMATGVIGPKSKQTQTSGSSGRTPRSGPAAGPAAPTAPTAGPMQGVVNFTGRFDEKVNTRKVEILCPACSKPVEAGIPKCPYCNQSIKWPDKVPCKFCGEKPGSCGVCQGTSNCPFCSKGRMLYGMRPPCTPCNNSGKCPACGGTGKCGYCEDGFYSPGRTPPPKPVRKLEPPPPEVKPEAPAPPPPADGTAPAAP
jgi:hypothetical protein